MCPDNSTHIMILCYVEINNLLILPHEGSDFMHIPISEIVLTADRLTKRYGTRNPYELADALGITIMPRQFVSQLGAYTKILNNRFIFIKDNLDEYIERIVLYHELGHDQLHQDNLGRNGSFREFHLFNVSKDRMEYEANVFAAQISIPDEDILELGRHGYDNQQIAAFLNTDTNLVGYKTEILSCKGIHLNMLEHNNRFLDGRRYTF